MQEIADELGRSHVTVSLWLSGKTTSQPIKVAATKKALLLLEKERRNAA